MNFKGHALILAVVESLRQHGSWTGKTHVQKALSLLLDWGGISLPFKFVLYKHGPYSFDVEAELEQMQSYGAIKIEPNLNGYGVVLHLGEMAEYVQNIAPLSADELKAIDDVCTFVGIQGVADLECLATVSWIRSQEKTSEPVEVAKRLNSLKPHISIHTAELADSKVVAWITRSRSFSGGKGLSTPT